MAINPSSAAPPAGEVISAYPAAWARAGAVGGERTASSPKTAAHITRRFTWPPQPGQSVILTSGRGPVKEPVCVVPLAIRLSPCEGHGAFGLTALQAPFRIIGFAGRPAIRPRSS